MVAESLRTTMMSVASEIKADPSRGTRSSSRPCHEIVVSGCGEVSRCLDREFDGVVCGDQR